MRCGIKCGVSRSALSKRRSNRIELYEELINFKQEREDLKREIHELGGDGKKEHKELKKMLNAGTRDEDKRSYSDERK